MPGRVQRSRARKPYPSVRYASLLAPRRSSLRHQCEDPHRRGEFIHIDIGGGLGTAGFSFIKEKSEIYDVLVYFVNHFLNQNILPSAFLRPDWAPGIDSSRVQAFLSRKGIKWEPTASYSPNQDGVSERGIQTILLRARCLIQAKLPKKLWAGAMVSVTF